MKRMLFNAIAALAHHKLGSAHVGMMTTRRRERVMNALAVGLVIVPALLAARVGNAASVGEHMLNRLRGLMDQHALIGDVRGKGLMIGVELVRDRATKERAVAERNQVVLEMFQRGILVLGAGRHVGQVSDRLSNLFDLILRQSLEDLSRGLLAERHGNSLGLARTRRARKVRGRKARDLGCALVQEAKRPQVRAYVVFTRRQAVEAKLAKVVGLNRAARREYGARDRKRFRNRVRRGPYPPWPRSYPVRRIG